jgi:prophage DNA circulation protein
MAAWEDFIQVGSFDGVVFDFVSTSDAGGNMLDRQLFPGRKGQKIEPRGENGDDIDVMAVFVEDDYPDTMNRLLEKLRGGKVLKFVHPIRGELQAACESWSMVHDVEDAIDSAVMRIKFAVHTDQEGLTAAQNTTPARANAVRSLADQVLSALGDFQASLDIQNSAIGLAVTGAINAATAIADRFEATGDELSVIAIQSTTNSGLSKADDAVALLADYSTTEQYDLSAAVLAMAHALDAMAQDLIDQRPPLSTFTVRADTNLLQLAHDTGQDAEELLSLNSFADPSLILAGSKYVAYVAR